MKERPILFRGPMVQAILDGRKMQTRRVAKGVHVVSAAGEALKFLDSCGPRIPCPYGQPGDRLWVREAWARTQCLGSDLVVYRVSDSRTDFGGPWKPSIHMRRADSRILLEVVSVHVEQLNKISEADAEAEGIGFMRNCPDFDETLTAEELYMILWEHIHGSGSWDENPLVWVIKFKRIEEAGQ